jgi:hypothetical protein
VRILTLVQGTYGHRITAHLQQARVPEWDVQSWALPPVLPPVIDYPEDYLPATLPAADLLLSLGEHPGVAELIPDIARMCGAQAVLAPIDNVAWLPPGLMRQLAGWLAEMDVPAVFPKPFCSLTQTTYNAYRRQMTYDVPLIAAFAHHFGKPAIRLTVGDDGQTIAGSEMLRDAPCGCAAYAAARLEGVNVEAVEETAGLLHHHYPCLAAMAIDPDYGDTLMHISGRILKEEVARGVHPYRQAPVYLRPSGRSE